MNKTKYLQGDGRWGGLVYPKKPCYIRDVGCGEVSISNILIEMEQYAKYTPATIQPYCKRYGSPSCDGTYLTGINAMMKHYGLKEVKECENMAELWKELEKGDRVAIYLMGKRPGGSKKIHWTSGGHFVASVDYKKQNGKHYLYIKDPWTNDKNRNGWLTYEEHMKNDIIQVSVGKLVGAKASAPDGKLVVDGIGGEETVKAMQKLFGTNESGIISGQLKKINKYYPSLVAVDYDKKGSGSPCIKKLQKWLGLTEDGVIGQGTTAAWQKKLRDLGYLAKSETIDGLFGVKSMKAWQKFLNDDPKITYPEKTPTTGTATTTEKKPSTAKKKKTVQQKIVAYAKKMAKDAYFHYVHWKKNDPKTKRCPICHDVPKTSKYYGTYCTIFPILCWHHGGGIKIKCDKAPNNGQIERIYNAKTDAEALRLARLYFGIKDIKVLRNKKGIPQKRLQAGDSCYYFRGGTCQHAFLYIGDGKMIDANSYKDKAKQIAVRKAMSCKVAVRYVGK